MTNIHKILHSVVIVIILILINVIVIFKINNIYNKLEIKTTQIEEIYKQKSINLFKTIEKNKEIISKLKEQNNILKSRIDDLNNKDILKSDINKYIDKKYQLVPRTVANEIAKNIVSISRDQDISPELILGIIQVESGFNPMAISKKNARGLMQVMPEWARKFNLHKVSDLHDIDTNILCGIRVLKIHIKEAHGNLTKGLFGYCGKDSTYANKVYVAIGEFITFRSRINKGGNVDKPNRTTKKAYKQSTIISRK